MGCEKLRNDRIDYSRGWFFVTTQVARNKSVFGVIADGRCELNELGRRVEERWRDLFRHRTELQCDASVIMPNHFHAVLKIHPHADNRIPHLSRAMQIFKSLAAHDYLDLLKAGLCPDIGGQLWMRSYYDNLISSHRELEAIRTYIRTNPASWEADRFGPVTAHHAGNLELLNQPCVAFVASEGGDEAPPPRQYVPEGPESSLVGAGLRPESSLVGAGLRPESSLVGAGLRPESSLVGAGLRPESSLVGAGLRPESSLVGAGLRPESSLVGAGLRPESSLVGAGLRPRPAVVSTFSSRQERAILAKCLATRRPYIHVMPAGIPQPLPPAWAKACAEGWALILSPFPPGTTLNKQRAIWCNQYVFNHADAVWCGTIRPGGTLESLLRLWRRHPTGCESK